MNEKHWLQNYLDYNYPNKKYTIIAIQRIFNELDFIRKDNVLYFGFFSGLVTVETPFQNEVITMKDTHSRPFLFSNISNTSNINEVFIGYEIMFEVSSKQ